MAQRIMHIGHRGSYLNDVRTIRASLWRDRPRALPPLRRIGLIRIPAFAKRNPTDGTIARPAARVIDVILCSQRYRENAIHRGGLMRRKKEAVLRGLNSRLIINSRNATPIQAPIHYLRSVKRLLKGSYVKARIIRVNTINCHDLFHPL